MADEKRDDVGRDSSPREDDRSGTALEPAETQDGKNDKGNGVESSDDQEEMDLSKTKSIAETLSLPHEIAFVATICTAQFTTQCGLGNTLSIIHVIGQSFGIKNPGVLSWLIAGYSLTVGTFILFSGRLGDVFGYKRLLLIGFSWFSFWSMVAGVSVYSNSVLFIFARVLQGIGPAIVLPNGLAILGATYRPGKRKAMVFATFGAMAPIGSIFGSTMGGLFALAWWPWTYWSFSLGLAAIVVVGSLVIPDPPCKDDYSTTCLRDLITSLDVPGAVVGVVGLVLINVAWNQAPAFGWQQPYIGVCLILGLLFIAGFFYIELKLAPQPLIPFDALSSDVGFVLGCIACGWGSFGVWYYYIYQFSQELRGASPLLVSAWFSPVVISGASAAIFTGWFLGKAGPGVVMSMAMTAFLTGTILIMTAPIDQIYWGQLFFSVVVMPFGMDMSFPAGTLILSNAVSKKHQGIAASLVNTVVNYSISLALGFAGTVEVHISPDAKTPDQLLKGYRAALYFGCGLASLGLMISLTFLAKSLWHDKKKSKQHDTA